MNFPEIQKMNNDQLAALEEGCAGLITRLQSFHATITHRLDQIAKIQTKITGEVSATISAVTAEFQANTNLVKQTAGPFTNYSGLLEAIGSVGTPETQAYVKIMRQQRQPLEKKVASRHDLSRSPKMMRRAIVQEIGDTDTGRIFFIGLLQFLESEKSSMIQPETRANLTAIIKRARFKGDTLDKIQARLNEICVGLEPMETLETELDNLQRLFRKQKMSYDALKTAEDILRDYETKKDTGPEDSLSFQRSRDSRELEKLDIARKELEKVLAFNIEKLKTHFTERPELVGAIPAVLRSIGSLCADLVKTEINDVSTWEIGIALRQWPAVQHQLGKSSPLKGIDADLVIAAMEYLNNHGDFLDSYNTSRNCRKKMEEIDEMIDVIRTRTEKPADDAEKPQARIERDRERLKKGITRARAESQVAMDELEAGLKSLIRQAGIATEKAEPAGIWDSLEKARCGDIFRKSELALDDCERQLNDLAE